MLGWTKNSFLVTFCEINKTRITITDKAWESKSSDFGDDLGSPFLKVFMNE